MTRERRDGKIKPEDEERKASMDGECKDERMGRKMKESRVASAKSPRKIESYRGRKRMGVQRVVDIGWL